MLDEARTGGNGEVCIGMVNLAGKGFNLMAQNSPECKEGSMSCVAPWRPPGWDALHVNAVFKNDVTSTPVAAAARRLAKSTAS